MPTKNRNLIDFINLNKYESIISNPTSYLKLDMEPEISEVAISDFLKVTAHTLFLSNHICTLSESSI